MITVAQLKALKESLKQAQLLIDTSLAKLPQEKLFKSVSDYKDALFSVRLCPQDFYKFRFFDCEIVLGYSLNSKQYYIKVDTANFVTLRKIDFIKNFPKDTFTDCKNEIKFLLNKDFTFDKCIDIFSRFCILWIHSKQESPVLFEVY